MKEIIEAIKNKRRFLITSHLKLDGDALGSELALFHLLRDMGKEASIYNEDPTPGNYAFLPGAERIVRDLPPLDGFDAAFVLDCSELDRVGSQAARIAAVRPLINIDHHVSNGGFTPLALVDPRASSTGELVLRLIEALGAPVTGEIATALYTAILTDTGGFRYSNTTPEALVAAGRLVEHGADPQGISQHVYEDNPPAKVRLLARAIQSLTFERDGRVGYLVVLQRDFAETQALAEHTEGFVDIPRSVKGVVVSVLFTEMPDGVFKVSLRSKNAYNVEQVARAFGGGGHMNAAACRIGGGFAEVRRRLMEEIGKIIAR